MRNLAAALLLLATACTHSVQNRYDYSELGKTQLVEFATVVSVRKVRVQGYNTGIGATAGAVGGGIEGAQFGGGGGQVATTVGGVLVGAVAGGAIEQAIADGDGYEYIIMRANGKASTIVQPYRKEDRIFKPGERVLVQLSGSYQRVLPAEDIPTKVQKPKGFEVVE